MVDSTGTTSWTFNGADENTQLAAPQGTVNYTYNSDGRRATMQEVGVGTTSYSYNDGGRLTSLQNPFSETTSFVYDDGGRLTQKTFESGQYEALTYDTRNRVTQILLKNSSHTTLRTQNWTYDNASNVATMTQGGVQTTFGYDDIDQLTSESRTGYSASYSYDANGNRLTRTIGSTTENYVYDDADKLDYIQISSVTVKDFSYDSAGRTTSVVVGSNTTSLTYDYENRVTQITYPNLSTNTFAYNGLDTRVSKVDSGGTKTYLRDGAGVTAPVINDAAASYTPGISERRSSTTTYYHGGIKNAETQSNTSQTVAATKTFDAFGNADTSTGTWNGPFSYGSPFGYQSVGDSGLMLLGHRYYDCSTGRFLTRDPIKSGRNWYAYVSNNPTSRADPDGLILAFLRKIWLQVIVRLVIREPIDPLPPITPPPPTPITRPLDPPGSGTGTGPGAGAGRVGGVFMTLIEGADAGFRGAAEVIKYRRKVQAAIDEAMDPYGEEPMPSPSPSPHPNPGPSPSPNPGSGNGSLPPKPPPEPPKPIIVTPGQGHVVLPFGGNFGGFGG